jgi:plastocyanin
MNNNLLIGVAVIAVAAGAWFITNNKAEAPETEDTPVTVETVIDTVTNDTTSPDDQTDATIDASIDASTDISIDTSDNAISFNVVGTNHAFDVKNMTVKKGQTVTINFANGDGMHDWVLDEFEGARTPVIKTGEKASITFVADQAGTFEYYCSVGNHRTRGMVGTFVVTE